MIRFNEIMTSDVVFYDKEYNDECKEFCRTRSIDRLPAIHDSRIGFRYSRGNKEFESFAIKPTQFVHPNDNIFKKSLIGKFQENQILFVVENDDLKGIVHFSDYNRPKVYEEIYKKLYKFERGLIFLISEYSGKSHKELEMFLGDQFFTANRNKLLSKRDFSKMKLNLKDIMEFALETDLLRVLHIGRINGLRNKIAHSKDLVEKNSPKRGSLKYDLQSFKDLILGNIALDIAIRQVSNRVYLMKAVNDENFALKTSNVYQEAFG